MVGRNTLLVSVLYSPRKEAWGGGGGGLTAPWKIVEPGCIITLFFFGKTVVQSFSGTLPKETDTHQLSQCLKLIICVA